jgi:hypothetical protein
MGWFLTPHRHALTIILVKICNLRYATVADGVVILGRPLGVKIGYLERVHHFG